MQKYSMSNKASIMSVLTLIISLVVLGLVSTGCGGGGGPTTYTLNGTAVIPPSESPAPGYGISVSSGNTVVATGTSGPGGAFSFQVPGSVIGVPSPALTFTFTYPTNGGLAGSQTVAITGGEITGTTINVGDVNAGPPNSPL